MHSTMGSTVHSMPLNSLEHCICTTTMTNIRPDRDSNLVPPGYKPQSIRVSHRGRHQVLENGFRNTIIRMVCYDLVVDLICNYDKVVNNLICNHDKVVNNYVQ